MRLEYKNKEKIFEEKNVDGVEYLSYPLIEKTGIVTHGFSTRIGGVSEGVCSTMNLSFARGDKEEAVRENGTCVRSGAGRYGMLQTDTYNQCQRCNRRRSRKRNYQIARLYGCGWTDHKCARSMSCDILCRLCAVVFCRSGASRHRIEPFRMERNCR